MRTCFPACWAILPLKISGWPISWEFPAWPIGRYLKQRLEGHFDTCYNMDKLGKFINFLRTSCSVELPVTKRTHLGWFHFYEDPRAVLFIETEYRAMEARDWGGEGGDSLCLMGTLSVWEGGNFLGVESRWGTWTYLTLPNSMLKMVKMVPLCYGYSTTHKRKLFFLRRFASTTASKPTVGKVERFTHHHHSPM